MLWAQVPGVDEAVEAATRRGWEAVVLVIVMIVGGGFFGWVFKRLLTESSEREIRLATRVTHLEELIRTELMVALRQNSEVMGKMLAASDAIIRAADSMTRALERFTSILDVRPCLLPNVEQRKLLKDFEDVENK
jgi:Trp operon repressor